MINVSCIWWSDSKWFLVEALGWSRRRRRSFGTACWFQKVLTCILHFVRDKLHPDALSVCSLSLNSQKNCKGVVFLFVFYSEVADVWWCYRTRNWYFEKLSVLFPLNVKTLTGNKHVFFWQTCLLCCIYFSAKLTNQPDKFDVDAIDF